MVVAIEHKAGAGWPEVPDRPQHGHLVLLIECIACVNEQEPSPFLLSMFIPKQMHGVYHTLNAHCEAGTELVRTTGHHHLDAGNPQDALHLKASPHLADADGLDTGALIQGDKSPGHESLVCSPGGVGIHHPLSELHH